MPKGIKLRNELVKDWTKGLKDFKITDENHVFCTICDKKITCDRKFQLLQHLKTQVHEKRKQANPDRSLQQQLIDTHFNNVTADKQFRKDLCNLFLSCNIPLYKLEHAAFINSLKKYCCTGNNTNTPSSSLLRNKYLDLQYQETLNKIKQNIAGKHIWFSIDEITNVKGGYKANLIIGILDSHIPTKDYLISCRKLEKTNNVTLSSFFLPERFPSEKILLMVSDGAPYMIKAAQNLKIFYTSLIRCTCVAHGINRVAEFPSVNKLITCGKKFFVKVPYRAQYYKEQLPDTPLLPEPIITRWGTWLQAAEFYADNLNDFKTVVTSFDASSCQAINDCVAVLNEKQLAKELAFIKTYFVTISNTITQLESNHLKLSELTNTVNKFLQNVKTVPGQVGQKVKQKFENVFKKNQGFNDLKQINAILNGDFHEEINLVPYIIANILYAPITSCDVERSFSIYKNILSVRCEYLTADNLEKYLVCSCFVDNEEN